jgi:acyl carrier protein
VSLTAELRQSLLARYLSFLPPAELTDTTPLLDSGLLDSMALVDLVTHLEHTYGVTIDTAEITPDNFASVAAISALVERHRQR